MLDSSKSLLSRESMAMGIRAVGTKLEGVYGMVWGTRLVGVHRMVLWYEVSGGLEGCAEAQGEAGKVEGLGAIV